MFQSDPRISLILCTLGRRLELERALESFTWQTMSEFQVIIVDQNEPGYLDHIINRFSHELHIRRIYAERGLSRARNIGMRHASGAIVGFPDDDCWYGPEVCRQVLDVFASKPNLGLLTGRTVDAKGKPSLSGDFRETPGPISRRDAFRTGNSNTFFLRHEAVAAVGGFDESLGVGAAGALQSGEETDLMIRCIDQGLETHYDPAFTVYHDQVAADRTEATQRRIKQYAMGFGHLLRKHRFGPLYLSYRLARSIAKAMLHVAQLDPWNARLRLSWASGTVRGFLMRPASCSAH